MRPVARCSRSSSISSTRAARRGPRRPSSPISMPKPGANGSRRAQQRRRASRAGRRSAPQLEPGQARGSRGARSRRAMPKPPPSRRAKTATARSQRPDSTASASGAERAAPRRQVAVAEQNDASAPARPSQRSTGRGRGHRAALAARPPAGRARAPRPPRRPAPRCRPRAVVGHDARARPGNASRKRRDACRAIRSASSRAATITIALGRGLCVDPGRHGGLFCRADLAEHPTPSRRSTWRHRGSHHRHRLEDRGRSRATTSTRATRS